MSPTRISIVFAFTLSLQPGCTNRPDRVPLGVASSALDDNVLARGAGDLVLYEVQARTANACDPRVGAEWQRQACRARPAPTIQYRGVGTSCGTLGELQQIRLGTLDDLVADTADYRAGITLRYVQEKVGANAVWLMPLYPNNDAWNLPDGCDNLGSPYAVRDYLHAQGSLARACIAVGRDEHDAAAPCWGTGALDSVIAAAHARGMKVMLDVAFNHFGHNYLLYDVAGFVAERDRLARGESLDRLWDFAATYDPALLHPTVIDDPAALAGADYDAVRARCPKLDGQDLVRAYHQWRIAFDWERRAFRCDAAALEDQLPAFYLGADAWNPSTAVGDNFTNDWRDVKFLYHHEDNAAHQYEFIRLREYLFRVLDYWSSRGVDGFRLDHTTDGSSGLAPAEWKYLTSKLDYYAWRRGQEQPIYLAEEFADQMGMSHVADVLTEGYVGDMCGRNGQTKDAFYVDRVVDNMGRFGGHSFVMTALETHDEKRLTDGTGFDPFTGAGFWGIGAATWSTPMLLMGQELGESWQLGFRRSDYLRSRFSDGAQDALTGFYHSLISARLDTRNRALRAPAYRYLPTRDGTAETRLWVAARWSDDGNVVFVAHNLWYADVAQSYYLPADLTAALQLRSDLGYRLVDALSGTQLGACRSGADLAWNFYVAMAASTRLQWMRLERC